MKNVRSLVEDKAALDLKAKIAEAGDDLVRIQECIDGLQIPDMAKRQHLGCASLHAAVEHSQGIVILVEEGLTGTALALLRPMLEAFTRGVWVLWCATETEIDEVGNDTFPSSKTIVAALEQLPRYSSGALSQIKGVMWSGLCSLTHAGTAQTIPRLGSVGIGSEFSANDAALALAWASQFGYASAGEFAILANRQDIADAIVTRLRAVGAK